MMKIYLSLATLLLFATTTHAQQPVALSRQACIEYALKNNYTVKNAHVDALIQEEQVKQSVAAAYPHINGKADFTYFNVPQRSFIHASTFATPGSPSAPPGTIIPIMFTIPYAASAAITTSQVLFDGSVMVALQARKAVVEMAKRTEEVSQETVRYNVYKAYNTLVIAYRQFDLLKNSLTFVRSIEHDMEIMRQNGMVEKIEVDRTSVQVNNLASDSMRIANILTMSEQMLKYQIGMNINTPIILTDTSIEKNQAELKNLIDVQESYERVPEFRQLNTALMLNQYNLKRYKLAALPSISGFWAQGSNYGSDKFDKVFEFNKYWANSTIGLTLNMPIFNGFVRVHQVREAQLNVDKTKNNIEFLKQSLDFQSESARTNLKNSLLQAQSQKRNLELSNNVLDLAEKKYKAGVGSNLEVTTAQTEQLRSMNNYFTALLDITNAEADLKKALGLLK